MNGVGLTFLPCQLSDGIIKMITDNAKDIGSKPDLMAVVPLLEDKTANSVMNILHTFNPTTVDLEL